MFATTRRRPPRPLLRRFFLQTAPAAAALCLWVAAFAQESPCPRMPGMDEALMALNAARAQGALCGHTLAGAAPGLRWNGQLVTSAQTYALELAGRNRLSHEGLVNLKLRDRVRATGYRMRLVGENLAVGPDRMEELMALWLASPEHCSNLMEPRFVDVGLACAPGRAPDTANDVFWVLHLGRSLQDGP